MVTISLTGTLSSFSFSSHTLLSTCAGATSMTFLLSPSVFWRMISMAMLVLPKPVESAMIAPP